jgi:hypothetical protein
MRLYSKEAQPKAKSRVFNSLREHKALPILGRALDMFDSHPAMKTGSAVRVRRN